MKMLDAGIVQAVREAHIRGERGKDIAARLGISPSTVSRIVTGSRHGRRVTPREMQAVRDLLAQGMAPKTVAVKMDIALSTVGRIAAGASGTLKTRAFDAERDFR